MYIYIYIYIYLSLFLSIYLSISDPNSPSPFLFPLLSLSLSLSLSLYPTISFSPSNLQSPHPFYLNSLPSFTSLFLYIPFFLFFFSFLLSLFPSLLILVHRLSPVSFSYACTHAQKALCLSRRLRWDFQVDRFLWNSMATNQFSRSPLPAGCSGVISSDEAHYSSPIRLFASASNSNGLLNRYNV